MALSRLSSFADITSHYIETMTWGRMLWGTALKHAISPEVISWVTSSTCLFPVSYMEPTMRMFQQRKLRNHVLDGVYWWLDRSVWLDGICINQRGSFCGLPTINGAMLARKYHTTLASKNLSGTANNISCPMRTNWSGTSLEAVNCELGR